MNEHAAENIAAHFDVVLAAVAAGRTELVRLHRVNDIDDETLHNLERDLDLEELGAIAAKVRSHATPIRFGAELAATAMPFIPRFSPQRRRIASKPRGRARVIALQIGQQSQSPNHNVECAQSSCFQKRSDGYTTRHESSEWGDKPFKERPMPSSLLNSVTQIKHFQPARTL